ncbi:MAG: hypothetical protein J7K26_02490, partial [Candidatus Aenigmarchaeota archaeon]|nr:hypothetical protein [Candidatus Aenigmarchaeota archaeon]
MEKRQIIFIMCFLLIIQIAFAYSLSHEASKAQTALELAQKNITEMNNSGFNTGRVNDIYIQAKEDFDAKLLLEQKGQDVDYSSIILRTNEIFSIHDQAFITYDELNALEMILDNLKDKNLNETFSLFEQAKSEFYNEQYEECMKLIDKTYDKLSEEQATKVTLTAFYEATSKTIKNFIIKNWKYILIAIITVSIFIILTYK